MIEIKGYWHESKNLGPFIYSSVFLRVFHHFVGVEQIFSAMIGYIGVIMLPICMDFMSKRFQNTISKLIVAASHNIFTLFKS